MTDGLLDVAHLSEPYWSGTMGERIKSLLLFFDGISVLVPDYMRDRPLEADPSLAVPLADAGLLHRLSPEQLIDEATSDTLTDLLDELLDSGALEDLDPSLEFAEISYSRLGGLTTTSLTPLVLERLQERGLARPTQDGVSIPLHPVIRGLVLTLLPQLLRLPAERSGLALQPLTLRPDVYRAFGQALRLARQPLPAPAAGEVVERDLDAVGIELRGIPLDEVLGFREDHGPAFRAYARDLRAYVRELSTMSSSEQQQALRDRSEELADMAAALRETAAKAWKKPAAAFGVGITGSAISLATGSPYEAIVGVAAALLGLERQADPATAYTYLFDICRMQTIAAA